MISYINEFIGITYADNPILYVLCFMLIMYFMHFVFQLMFIIFGVHK